MKQLDPEVLHFIEIICLITKSSEVLLVKKIELEMEPLALHF